MTTRQAQAVRRLWQSQLSAGGLSGRYERDKQDVELRAVPGRQADAGGTYEDVPVIATDSVWLFFVEDLRIDGEAILPAEGDEWIWEKNETIKEKYAVLPPSENEKCWTYTDQTQLIVRVHMKRRETIDDG